MSAPLSDAADVSTDQKSEAVLSRRGLNVDATFQPITTRQCVSTFHLAKTWTLVHDVPDLSCRLTISLPLTIYIFISSTTLGVTDIMARRSHSESGPGP